MRSLVRLSCVPAVLVLLATAGCLQIDTRVKVHEDGSVTITERVQLSRRLLDLSRMQKEGKALDTYLGKEHVLKRVAEMGKGATLVRHEVRSAEQGSRECVSVIKIPDLNNLRYVSPFLANYDYPKHPVLRFKLAPCYKTPHYGLWPGQMYVQVWPETRGRAPRRSGDGESPPPPTPADLQVYRDLRPVFRDMLQGARVRLVVESYAPIGMARGYYYYRGQRAATREYDLIDFSSKDFDRYGYDFLSNEEIMLELLRFQLSGGDLMETIKPHPNNLTVPVYHTSGIPQITFRPSRTLFDRHFKGKTLHFNKKNGGPRIANYKEIGLQAEKKDTSKKAPPKKGGK